MNTLYSNCGKVFLVQQPESTPSSPTKKALNNRNNDLDLKTIIKLLQDLNPLFLRELLRRSRRHLQYQESLSFAFFTLQNVINISGLTWHILPSSSNNKRLWSRYVSWKTEKEIGRNLLYVSLRTRCHTKKGIKGSKPRGILAYMGHIGTCRCEGYGFQAVYWSIGYINQSVWV